MCGEDVNRDKGINHVMITVLMIMLWIAGIVCFAISCYLFLTIFIGSFRRENKLQVKSCQKRFAVIIPAHNESAIIENTLRSVLNIDYPESLFDIFVIADNCSDNTAEKAKKMKVHCLERNDPKRFGKGHALKWFFEYAIDNNFSHDAFLVVDADTFVSNNILKAMNREICSGRDVLTSRYEIARPERSVTSSITFFAFLLRNLKNKGLDFLGGSAQLLGNGMCFTTGTIKKYGWYTTSITEDREQWANLYIEGINVRLVDDTSIYAAMPGTFKEYRVPRARWDIGNFEVNKRYFIPFLKVFLKKRNLPSFAMLMELITPPTTYFFFINIIFFSIAMLAAQVSYKGFYTSILWTANISLFFISILMGLVKSDAPFELYKNILLYLPFYVAWRIWNLVRGYIKGGTTKWIRSKRD